MQNQPQTSMQDLVIRAKTACIDFTTLLTEENEALKNNQMDILEKKYKLKRQAAAKMEALLNEVQTSQGAIKQDRAATDELGELQVVINNYQQNARKNVLLLRAAHDATTSFLNLVKEAVSKHKPKVSTYGDQGHLEEKTSPTNLVDTSI